MKLYILPLCIISIVFGGFLILHDEVNFSILRLFFSVSVCFVSIFLSMVLSAIYPIILRILELLYKFQFSSVV